MSSPQKLFGVITSGAIEEYDQPKGKGWLIDQNLNVWVGKETKITNGPPRLSLSLIYRVEVDSSTLIKNALLISLLELSVSHLTGDKP